MSWIFQCACTSPQILCFAECKQRFRDGFHSFSGQANTTVARPGILNCKYSLSKFSPLVSCHLGIWLLLLFFLSPEKNCLTENIYLPRGSAIRWVCATVRRDIFFAARSFEFCIIILTRVFCFVLFSVGLSGLWQKNPKQTKKNPNPRNPNNNPEELCFVWT